MRVQISRQPRLRLGPAQRSRKLIKAEMYFEIAKCLIITGLTLMAVGLLVKIAPCPVCVKGDANK
jgi:hypothetical protein